MDWRDAEFAFLFDDEMQPDRDSFVGASTIIIPPSAAAAGVSSGA